MIYPVVQKILKYNYLEFFRSIMWAVLLALIFRTCFYEPFAIPSSSMANTLIVGDYLFVSKFPYGYSKYSLPFGLPIFNGRIFFKKPKAGDIIVFKGVNDPYKFYIKRVIGLPGDTVQLRNGNLYLNGQLVKHELVDAQKNCYREILPNGKEYMIWFSNADSSTFPNDTVEYKVPPNHYFFMGDNRDNSIDSRFLDRLGFVPQDHLVGRADFLLIGGDFSFWKLVKHLDIGRSFTKIK